MDWAALYLHAATGTCKQILIALHCNSAYWMTLRTSMGTRCAFEVRYAEWGFTPLCLLITPELVNVARGPSDLHPEVVSNRREILQTAREQVRCSQGVDQTRAV